MAVGLLALWSASAVQKNHADFRAQVIGIVLGIPLFVLFFVIDPRFWARYSRIVYAVMIGLLLLVRVPGIGRSAGGAERWVSLGPVQLQPSEIAKLLMIITLADYLTRQDPNLRTIAGFLKSLLFIVPPFVLVALQPNLSTSLVFLCIWAGMSLVADQRVTFLGGSALIAIAAVTLILLVPNPFIKRYQLQRVDDYFASLMQGKPTSFHGDRAEKSVGSGRIIGEGYQRGALKEARYVPEATTDFVFTVIAEEGGFVGSVLVLSLYGFFLWRVWLVVMSANLKLFRYMATGIFVVFSFHTLVNLLVVVGLLPVTGVPLPFMSFGRSAMLLSLAAVGLLLNIRSRERKLVF